MGRQTASSNRGELDSMCRGDLPVGGLAPRRLYGRPDKRTVFNHLGQMGGYPRGYPSNRCPGRLPGRWPGRLPDRYPGRLDRRWAGRLPDRYPGRLDRRWAGRLPSPLPGGFPGRFDGRLDSRCPGRFDGRYPDRLPGCPGGCSSPWGSHWANGGCTAWGTVPACPSLGLLCPHRFAASNKTPH
jgi:hypothetical protein